MALPPLSELRAQHRELTAKAAAIAVDADGRALLASDQRRLDAIRRDLSECDGLLDVLLRREAHLRIEQPPDIAALLLERDTNVSRTRSEVHQ